MQRWRKKSCSCLNSPPLLLLTVALWWLLFTLLLCWSFTLCLLSSSCIIQMQIYIIIWLLSRLKCQSLLQLLMCQVRPVWHDIFFCTQFHPFHFIPFPVSLPRSSRREMISRRIRRCRLCPPSSRFSAFLTSTEASWLGRSSRCWNTSSWWTESSLTAVENPRAGRKHKVISQRKMNPASDCSHSVENN